MPALAELPDGARDTTHAAALVEADVQATRRWWATAPLPRRTDLAVVA